MTSKTLRLGLFASVLFACSASAQDTPILDMVANKVIEKYQNATCEQLWEQRGQPKSPQEQKVLSVLQSDPALRTQFLDKVAAPIANKLFSCGMIP